jgi:hypothetical protein
MRKVCVKQFWKQLCDALIHPQPIIGRCSAICGYTGEQHDAAAGLIYFCF